MTEKIPDAKNLVDAMSLARQLATWEDEIHEAIKNLGFEHIYLPHCTFIKYYEEVPQEILIQSLQTFSQWYEERYESLPKRVYLRESAGRGRWWYYLEFLDCKGKLSPVLWVKRDILPAGRPPKYVKGKQAIRFFIDDPMNMLTKDEDYHPIEEEGLRWCVGAEVDFNRWWYWDTRRASGFLNRLSQKGLQRELSSGNRIMRSSEETHNLWERQWIMRPIQYGPYEELTGFFPFPELGAVPFYRLEDQKVAFETIISSHICITPLDDVTDTEFASWKIIAKAREQGKFPRKENRGRRRRNMQLVQQAASLVYKQKMTKYGAAKKLGLPRSTYLGYLNEWEKRRKHVE